MTAVESLESHKQPFHPSHRPCKSRQTSGICTFPPPDDESSLVYRLNAKSNPETINPWVGQNKMPNWTNFSCQKQHRNGRHWSLFSIELRSFENTRLSP